MKLPDLLHIREEKSDESAHGKGTKTTACKIPAGRQAPSAPADSLSRQVIAEQCAELTQRLSDIRAAFDMTCDEALTDALIYEENAVQCRLSALYKQARALGVRVEVYEREKHPQG